MLRPGSSSRNPTAGARLTLGLLAGLLAAGSIAAHPGIDDQIAHVTTLIEKDPQNATLFLRRGELYRIHRAWADAEADYAKSRKLDPDLALVDLCMGKLQLDADKPAEAKQALDLYLARRPHDADALAFHGRALARLGQHVAAAASFTRAIANVRSDRPKPEYYLERAQALEAAGISHLDEALHGLDEGLAKLGNPVVLQNYAIELELKGRRYDAALARLARMASRAQRKETWLVRKGEILERAKRFDEARAAYEQSLVAVDALPASRRQNRAVEKLVEQARTALARLEETPATK